MAQQIIDVGNVANDGTGDPLRTAFQIVNENFTETYNPSYLANGSSRIDVLQDGDILMSSNGVANVMVVSSTQVTITGDLAVTGNAILSGNILGDRIQNGNTIIDIQSPGGNANVNVGGVANVTVFAPTGQYITGRLSASGNITASELISNYNTTVGNSLYVLSDGTVNGNIAVVGSISSASLSVTGNIVGGLISTVGNIVGNNIQANLYTGTTVSIGSNVTGGNLLTSGLISATGTITSAANIVGTQNITGGNVLTGGEVSATGNVIGSNVQTSGTVSASGNIVGSNVLTSGIVSATGNVYGDYLIGTLFGNVVASSISVSGNIEGGNLLTTGILSATSNIFGHDLTIGTGSTGNAIIYGNLTVFGNTTTINSNTITTNDLNITVGNNQNTGAALNNAGLDVGNNDLATWRYNDATVSWQTNLPITPSSNALLNLGAPTNYWNTAYLSAASVTGNTTSGNILTIGIVSASGNVTGGNIQTGGVFSATGNITGANILTGGIVSAVGNIVGANISAAGIISASSFNGSDISASANITGGNVLTGGIVSATGAVTSTANITGANILTGGIVSSTGNLTGGNILTGGQISAAGNVFATNIGNVAALNLDGNISNVLLGNGTFGNTPATLGALNYIQNSVATTTVVNTTDSFPYTVVDATLTTNGNPVQVIVTGDANPLAAGNGEIQLYRDSTAIGQPVQYESDAANENVPYALQFIDVPPVEGTYTYALKVNSLTANAQFGENSGPVLSAIEIQNVKGEAGSPFAWRTISANGTNIISNESQATITYTPGNNIIITGNATSNVVTFAVSDSPSFVGNVTGANLLSSGLISTSSNIVGANLNGNLHSTTASVSGNATIGNANIGAYTANALRVNGTAYIVNSAVADPYVGTGTLEVAAVTRPNVVVRAYSQTTSNTSGPVLDFVRKQQTGTALSAGLDAGRMQFWAIQPNNDTYNYIGEVTGITSGSGTDGQLEFYTGLANVPQQVLVLDSSKRANFAGAVSAVGNVTGSYIFGNGSLLTGVITSAANINNGTSNVTVVSSGGNITVGIGGTSNVAVFATTGLSVTGNVISSALVQGATVSASGNVQAGNLTITGLASVTGNITGENIVTSGTTGSLSVNSITHTGTNAVGNIGSSSSYFNQLFATATTALYADLAEKYAADADYAPGTVVSIGGTQEVTKSTQDGDRAVIGVVSTNPSYTMNSGLESEFVVTVALTGRVPCLVNGPVKRGDLLISAGNGHARAETDPRVGSVIGKALSDFDGNVGTVEIVIGKH